MAHQVTSLEGGPAGNYEIWVGKTRPGSKGKDNVSAGDGDIRSLTRPEGGPRPKDGTECDHQHVGPG